MNEKVPALSLVILALSCGLWSQQATLKQASFLPTDKMQTILSLSAAARVSVRATSTTGVGISLHDRMEGMIGRSGSVGNVDGRIDLSLDKGDYEVRIEGADSGGKAIGLSASVFHELNGDKSSAWPTLVPGAVTSGALKDLESASYWVELREDGPIEVEALGRDLAVAELWREGQYLVASYPIQQEKSVEEGRPMGWVCISRQAKAGLYLVRLYGGPSRAWPKDDPKRPLFVRSGFTRLPQGGRLDLAISPFGRDFILAQNIDRAVLSRRDKGVGLIASTAYAPGRDRLSSNAVASLSKTSASLSCSVSVPSGLSLLRVEGAPGDVLLLDAGQSLDSTNLPRSDLLSGGLLTVSAPRSSAPELEPSGLVFRTEVNGFAAKARVVQDFCVPLSSSASIRRRCNVGNVSDRSLYIRVEESGSYRIAEKTGVGQAAATYRMDLLDQALRPSGLAKAYPANKALLELVKGYYRLDISALSIGVLDFILYKDGFARVVSGDLAKDPPATRGFYAWTFAPDSGATDLQVISGRGPAFSTLMSYRPFPLAVADGLSLELGAGEELTVPVASDVPGRFRWGARGGAILFDGQAPSDGALLTPGKRTAVVRNSSKASAAVSFGVVPDFGDMPPPVSTTFGKGLEPLSAAMPAWRDFGRNETTVYAFEVKESSVYVIESLGRLSTSFVLRTASRTRLFQAAENGYGRNASLRTWLRQGQYYLEATTTRSAAGRAGIRMDRVPLLAQASLDSGAVDRRAVPADTAVLFAFSIPAPSRVDVNSVGLSGVYPVRLEDEDGFIVYAGDGRAKLALQAGRYALYALPAFLDTNRLTWIKLADTGEAPAPVAGTRGLGFNSTLSAVWRDSSPGDRYSFVAPADMAVAFRIPAQLDATLAGPGAGGTVALDASARSSVPLKRGTYVLTLKAHEKANQLPYTIGMDADGLAPGIVQGISVGRAGATTKVNVPDDGFYEIWSLGRNDITGRLYREGSRDVVASDDDNGPDWNIDIVQRLKAGTYRLDLASIAGAEDAVELHMVSRNAKPLAKAVPPIDSRLAIDESGLILPFDTKLDDGLYLVSADSDAPVSLRLYRGDDLIAAADGSIAIPLRKGSSYSLYAWTPFAATSKISVKRLGEQSASLSAPIQLKAGAVVRLQNPDAISARVSSGSALVSPGFELPCADPGAAPFSALPDGGWAYAPGDAASIEPLALTPGEGAVLTLAAADQGFTIASADKAILLAADTRGQFRSGLSAVSASAPGAAPYDWQASAAWSQGGVALLPPGSWKARVWDGERGQGLIRRIGVGADLYEMAAGSPLAMGARKTLTIPAGKCLAMDAPACTLSTLLGEGLVISAWKDGQSFATRSSYDGRATEAISVPACRIYIANSGIADASVRLIVLPAKSQVDEELSSARPFEAVNLPPEGIRLQVKAAAQERLCLAGDSVQVELETKDGRYASASRDPADGPFTSLPVSDGAIRIRSAGGFVRAWLAKSGKEIDGLVDADPKAAPRELKDAALLTGKGDAFRFSLAAPGYVDISCPGPGLLSLNGSGQSSKILVSGSRDDMHLFAWLGGGDYTLWQRPARGSGVAGIVRLDKIESQVADGASLEQKAFIGAGEYQAWSFAVSASGLVGVGVKADSDGLQGFLYDSRQGLVAKGPLMFATLDPGNYLLVVKGLDAAPIEYSLVLDGTEGSRQGVPQDVLDSYKAGGGAGASIAVPLRGRGVLVQPENTAQDEQASSDGGDGQASGDQGDNSDSGDYTDNGDDQSQSGDGE